MTDLVNHPAHYTQHPSGVECIEISEHLPANLANAFKYLWRSGLKGGADDAKRDLDKALFYLRRELSLQETGREPPLERFLAHNEDPLMTLILGAGLRDMDDALVIAEEMLTDRIELEDDSAKGGAQ